jgi:L,D-transpeptidase YcbB
MERIAAGLLVALTIAGCQQSDARPDAGDRAAVYGAVAGNVRPGQVTARLEQLLWDQRAPDYIRNDLWHLVRASYDRRQYQPYWVGAGAPGRAAALVSAVCRAEDEGLRSADYRVEHLASELAELRRFRSADRLGELDLLLTGALFAYGQDLLLGRITPATVAPEWDAGAPIEAAERLLQQMLAGTVSLDSALAALRPRSAAYAALVGELRPLRAADASGGWAEIPDDQTLRRGVRGPAVDALRRRLAATGELAASDTAAGRPFDRALAAAVARFQARHGLGADGVAGQGTIEALNVPAALRIAQIEANLERYRWIPENLLTSYAMLDVPNSRLTVEGSATPLVMTARLDTVARRALPPVVADTISELVLNPYWTVPADAVRDVVLPAVRADRGFAERAGLEVWRHGNGEPVRLDSVDWSSDSLAAYPYSVRQRPGPRNVIGPVRLALARHAGIHLQGRGRPAEPRLAEVPGARSIVVERPIELAAALSGRPAEELRAATEAPGGQTQAIDLALPFFLLDPTVRREGDETRFAPAVAGRDVAIAQALGPARPQPAERCEALALSAASAVLSEP